jgi:hypothetical protein
VILSRHFDTFLSCYAKPLANGAGWLTIATIWPLLSKTGIEQDVIANILSHAKLPRSILSATDFLDDLFALMRWCHRLPIGKLTGPFRQCRIKTWKCRQPGGATRMPWYGCGFRSKPPAILHRNRHPNSRM